MEPLMNGMYDGPCACTRSNVACCTKLLNTFTARCTHAAADCAAAADS